MPLVAFSSLPDDARVWVFGAAKQLDPEAESLLLETVDDYLGDWCAHGSPLTVGREWRDRRFLAIAVDQRDENASGCSLDALFRLIRGLEPRLGTPLLGNSRVYFRTRDGAIEATDRPGFAALAGEGRIRPESRVFDLSVQTAGDWRNHFEADAANTWHRTLIPEAPEQ